MANKQMKTLIIKDKAYDVVDETARRSAEATASAVSEYDDRISAVENGISTLEGDISDVENDVTSLGTRMTTAEGKIKNITISASDPSGGSDGDIWIKYING